MWFTELWLAPSLIVLIAKPYYLQLLCPTRWPSGWGRPRRGLSAARSAEHFRSEWTDARVQRWPDRTAGAGRCRKPGFRSTRERIWSENFAENSRPSLGWFSRLSWWCTCSAKWFIRLCSAALLCLDSISYIFDLVDAPFLANLNDLFIFLLICNRPMHSFYINLESWLL